MTQPNLLLLTCLSIGLVATSVEGQRNLLHLRHDLEFRLGSYYNQRRHIDDILASSIYPSHQNFDRPISATFPVSQVRFSDLIIPQGSLLLDRHIAQPTVKILANRTRSYVESKMNELYQVQSQLEHVRRQVESQQYIYKGFPPAQLSPKSHTNFITGTRVFKQFGYAQLIDSDRVDAATINNTHVDRVLNETYMVNADLNLVDPQSRLFFEGRKTFWRTEFSGKLRSGCCNRMRPLNTDKMMTRHSIQEVNAPVMMHSNNSFGGESALIRNLTSGQFYNRLLVPSQFSDNGLLPTTAENLINLNNLIHTKFSNQPEIVKSIIFNDVVRIEEAQLIDPLNARGLVIGIFNMSNIYYDLNHANYLLRFAASKNFSGPSLVPGTVVLKGSAHVVRGVDVDTVNDVSDIGRFVKDNVVRLNQPTTIRGSVQFTALPSVVDSRGDTMHHLARVPMMFVGRSLDVGRVNGLRIPEDLLFAHPSPMTLPFDRIIQVQGPREFSNVVQFEDILQVNQLVRGIQMPQGVVPLHLNDFMGSVGSSNLWFVDGISTQHMTVQSGQLDDIMIRDYDAQNIIMRSVFSLQPDGTHLIKAPLNVLHLRLVARNADQGLLNGFRPQSLLELRRQPVDASVVGSKTFLGPIEADECVFSDINGLSNWPNHFIRIDRPNLVQNIHTRLAFSRPLEGPNIVNNSAFVGPQIMGSSVSINNFKLELYPDDPVNHVHNWNMSPEFYIMHEALTRATGNHSGGRYRIIDRVNLMKPDRSLVNGVSLGDVVTTTEPFRYGHGFVMVGKVTVGGNLKADRITSNYPLDKMDLVQFSRVRLPIMGSRVPIRLASLFLSANNRASFVQTRMLNGISFSEFSNSIMSLTRPQIIGGPMSFGSQIIFEGITRTGSTFNDIENFKLFANKLRSSKYTFEDGLQCDSIMIK